MKETFTVDAVAAPSHASASVLLPVSDRLRVLIVDDNPELVATIQRTLAATCHVLIAYDGLAGLEAARLHGPDLVIIDVTMPKLDGFGLLREIRADASVETVPIIMLSGDASEEARIEALRSGADDYLLKPFKSRELIARIHSHVRMVRLRRRAFRREAELLGKIGEIEHDLKGVLESTHDAFMNISASFSILSMNRAARQLFNVHDYAPEGRSLLDIAPALRGSAIENTLTQAIWGHETVTLEYHNPETQRWFDLRCYPARHGATLFGADVTVKKTAELSLLAAHAALEERVAQRTHELKKANELLTAVFDTAPGGIALIDRRGKVFRANRAYQTLVQYSENELRGRALRELTDPRDWPEMEALLDALVEGRRASGDAEIRYRMREGGAVWTRSYLSLIPGASEEESYFVQIAQDITARKRANDRMLASQRELRALYRRLENAREEERISLAREVHDQLGQLLSAAKIDIKLLEDAVQDRGASLSRRNLATELRSARIALEQGILSVRAIATELRPPELEDNGLPAAISMYAERFEKRSRIICDVRFATPLPDLRDAAARALFRIYQESLTNVLRHAGATAIHITLARRGNSLLLRVADNGCGIDRAKTSGANSLGLKGMRERAAIAGGKVLIGRARPRGTLVAVRLPLDIGEHG